MWRIWKSENGNSRPRQCWIQNQSFSNWETGPWLHGLGCQFLWRKWKSAASRVISSAPSNIKGSLKVTVAQTVSQHIVNNAGLRNSMIKQFQKMNETHTTGQMPSLQNFKNISEILNCNSPRQYYAARDVANLLWTLNTLIPGRFSTFNRIWESQRTQLGNSSKQQTSGIRRKSRYQEKQDA